MPADRLRELLLSAADLQQKGDLDGAESVFRTIHQEFPRNADALFMLGLVAHQRGRHHDAVGLFQHAIDLNPGKIDFFDNLAKAWLALERYRLAAEAWKDALRLDPKNAPAALNIAMALWEIRDVDATVEYSRLAIALDPNLSLAHGQLAGALALQGDTEASLNAYREALRLKPDWPGLHSDLVFATEQDENSDTKAIAAAQRQWNQRHAEPLKRLMKPHAPRDPSRRKLRIGWVSPDFRLHVVSQCVKPVFEAFDRGQFENFAYSSVAKPDAITEEIKARVDVWRDISPLNDDAAADLIRADAIDVLVDLAVHTANNRLLVFARKPAPVQATYLGYAGNTGLDTIDFRITNARLDPPDPAPSGHSEKPALLTGSYLCYRPRAAVGDIVPPPALKNGFVTFACLNATEKLTPSAFDLWIEILRAVPGSRLILYVISNVFRRRIQSRFAASGIAPQRLEFVAKQSFRNYANTLNRADIALDTFPYGGGITACDALWMGLPNVTLIGNFPVGRMCYSILYDVRHTEWAAPTPGEYVQIAAALAADLPRLAQIRANLRTEFESSPVMNAPAVAADLGRVLKEISTANKPSI